MATLDAAGAEDTTVTVLDSPAGEKFVLGHFSNRLPSKNEREEKKEKKE